MRDSLRGTFELSLGSFVVWGLLAGLGLAFLGAGTGSPLIASLIGPLYGAVYLTVLLIWLVTLIF